MSQVNTIFTKLLNPVMLTGSEAIEAQNKLNSFGITINTKLFIEVCEEWVTEDLMDYIRSESSDDTTVVEDWSKLYVIDCLGMTKSDIETAFNNEFECCADFDGWEVQLDDYNGTECNTVVQCYVVSDDGAGFWLIMRNAKEQLCEPYENEQGLLG